LRIADAEDLRRGIMPEAPGREGDRGQQRLQVARRQVDDQPVKGRKSLKILWLGGYGWKIGWKILFAYCSGVLTCRWATRKRATARVLTKVFRLYRAVVAVDECEA